MEHNMATALPLDSLRYAIANSVSTAVKFPMAERFPDHPLATAITASSLSGLALGTIPRYSPMPPVFPMKPVASLVPVTKSLARSNRIGAHAANALQSAVYFTVYDKARRLMLLDKKGAFDDTSITPWTRMALGFGASGIAGVAQASLRFPMELYTKATLKSPFATPLSYRSLFKELPPNLLKAAMQITRERSLVAAGLAGAAIEGVRYLNERN